MEKCGKKRLRRMYALAVMFLFAMLICTAQESSGEQAEDGENFETFGLQDDGDVSFAEDMEMAGEGQPSEEGNTDPAGGNAAPAYSSAEPDGGNIEPDGGDMALELTAENLPITSEADSQDAADDKVAPGENSGDQAAERAGQKMPSDGSEGEAALMESDVEALPEGDTAARGTSIEYELPVKTLSKEEMDKLQEELAETDEDNTEPENPDTDEAENTDRQPTDYALSALFGNIETLKIENDLGVSLRSARKIAMRLFAGPTESTDRFDMYYIKYDDNLATTKTAEVQDLIGNMDKEKQTIKYQVEFHNDTDYEVGEVGIYLDYSIFTDRYGNKVTPSDMGIPQAPGTTKSSSFNYTILEDINKIYVTNCKPILAGTNNMFQIFYDIDDMATVDETAWSISSELELKGESLNPNITLTGSMDTKTVLQKVDKRAYSTEKPIYPEVYTKKQVENLAGILPDEIEQNFDNYRYILWRTEITGYADQPWDLTVLDEPDSGGIVLGQDIRGQNSDMSAKKYQTAEFTLAGQDKYKLDGGRDDTVLLWTLVAYPIVDGYIGDNNHVKNSVKVSLTGVDDGITTTLEDEAEWLWEEYRWDYEGNTIGMRKYYGNIDRDYISQESTEPGWYTLHKLNIQKGYDTAIPKEWMVKGILRGYDFVCPPIAGTDPVQRKDNSDTNTFTLTTVDDIQYVRSNLTSLTKMDYKDYYYASVNVKVVDTEVDMYEDEYTTAKEGLDTIIWVMTADDPDTWQQAAVVPYTDAYNGGKGYDLPLEWIGRGVYRIKAEHSSNDYCTDCYITGKTVIRADSQLVNSLMADDGATRLYVENLGGVYGTATVLDGAYMQDQSTSQYSPYPDLLEDTEKLYGTVLMRDNEECQLTEISEVNKIEKSGSSKNNPERSGVDLTYTIRAYDGYKICDSSAAAYFEESGITADRDTVTLYDLLPYGMSFDPTVEVRAGSCSALLTPNIGAGGRDGVTVTYSVTDNYKDSGRQLVTFTLTYEGEGNGKVSKAGSENCNYWYSGWAVNFGAFYEWKNISSCNGAVNVAAFQTPDRMKGKANADDGTGVPFGGGGYLYDLDADGDTSEENVIYSSCSVSSDYAVAAEAEIEKMVKEDANTYGVPELDASGVELTKNYTYYVTLTNGNSKLSDLVIFDRLENAGDDRGMGSEKKIDSRIDWDDNWWYGTYVSTNIELLESKWKINPVVYYNENRDAPVREPGDKAQTGLSVLTEANGWYTADRWEEIGKEPSDVKAIAYDLTKKQDGSDFVLPEMKSLSFTIRMKAPDSMQTEVPNTAAKDTNAAATYAYNNVMYYSTQTGNKSSVTDTVVGNSTSIKLYTNTKLSVAKSGITGSGAPMDKKFKFIVRIADKPYSMREYTLYERPDVDGQWQKVEGIYSTDADGMLKLTLNQKAEFSSVPAGENYEVEELSGLQWNPSYNGEEKEKASGKLLLGEDGSVEVSNEYMAFTYFEKKIGYDNEKRNKEDAFTFTMYLNGGKAANQTYYLVDAAIAMKKEPMVISELKTDADGKFTIKGNERILVVQRQGDTYKFVEDAACYGDGTNYDCENPEAEGEAIAPYTSADILNKTKYRQLSIAKHVEGKEGGDYSEEEFKFILYLDQDGDGEAKEPYAGMPYSIYTSENGARYMDSGDTGTTGADGSFTIKGGWKIVFDNIIHGTNYRFAEQLEGEQKDNYYIGEQAHLSGAVQKYSSETMAEATNNYNKRDLEVTKTVISKPNEVDDTIEFTFTIRIDKDGDGDVSDGETYADKTYILTDAEGNTEERSTDNNGRFILKPGEHALFEDITIGTAYRITEEKTDGYIQVTPKNGKDIEGKINDTKEPTSERFVNVKRGENMIILSKSVVPGDETIEPADRTLLQKAIDLQSNYPDYGDDPIPDPDSTSSRKQLKNFLSYFQVTINGEGYDGDYIISKRNGDCVMAKAKSIYDLGSVTSDGNYERIHGVVACYPDEQIILTDIKEGDKYEVVELLFSDSGFLINNKYKLFYEPTEGQSVYSSGEVKDVEKINYVNKIECAKLWSFEKYVNGKSLFLDEDGIIESLGLEDKQMVFQLQKYVDGQWIPAANALYSTDDEINGLSVPKYTDENGYIYLKPVYSEFKGRLYVPKIILNYSSMVLYGKYYNDDFRYRMVEVEELTDKEFGTFVGYYHKRYDEWDHFEFSHQDIEDYCYYNIVDDKDIFGNSYKADCCVIDNNTEPDTVSFRIGKIAENSPNEDETYGFTLYSLRTLPIEEGDELTVVSDDEAVINKKYRLFEYGRVYGDASYRQYNMGDVKEITDQEYMTDENGHFTLKSGQYALFENVPAGGIVADYYTDLFYFVVEDEKNGYDISKQYDQCEYPSGDVWLHDVDWERAPWGISEHYEGYGRRNGCSPNIGAIMLNVYAYNSVKEVMFINTYDPSADLKVSKSVIQTGEEEPGQETFTFQVKVDGKPYANKEYRLFGREYDSGSGKRSEVELYNVVSGGKKEIKSSSKGGYTVPFVTDEYGEFEIPCQWYGYALFENVGAGAEYEVTEVDIPKGYTQTTPAPGTSVSGVIPTVGTEAGFVNSYGTESGALTVRKVLAYPEGLELPEADTEFTFAVEVADEEYSTKEYTVYDLSGKEMGKGRTDVYGQLKLKANQYAVFKDVKAGFDYSVKEILDEDSKYHLVTSKGTTGGTSSQGVTADFTNGVAAFMVGKTVTASKGDSLPENDAFNFNLYLDGNVAQDIPYWIYDLSGNLTGEGKTDLNGMFSITSGERAMFYGIKNGVSYQIKESGKENYTQLIPENPNGYFGTVSDTVPTYVFENDYEKSSSLFVGKRVSVDKYSHDLAPADAEFTFKIEIKTDGEYVPYANALYSLSKERYRTDAEGLFKLKAGEVAEFTKLLNGTEFRVTELYKELPPNFTIDYKGFEKASSGDAYKTGKHTAVSETIIFNNNYYAQEEGLEFHLPSTGGGGILITTLIGLIALGGAILLKNGRSQNKT